MAFALQAQQDSMDSLQLDLTALAEQLEQKGETSPAFSWDNHAAAPAPGGEMQAVIILLSI